MAELVIKLVNGELAGQTMQTITKAVRDANTEFKKAEIGTQAYVDASKKLKQAEDRMAAAKQQAQGLSSASDILKKAFSTFPGAQQFQAIGAALNSARGGVGGLTSSFGLLKGAIAATGIGLLVLAIAGLVGWFSKTDAGANMIGGAFKALGNVVDVLMDKIWNIGNTLKELFSDPLQFFKNLGNDIAAAAEEGYEFVQSMDAIEDKARELNVQNSETEKVVSQLLLQSKNVGLSYKERIGLLDQASAAELKNHQDQLANAKALEDLLEKDFQRAVERGTDTDDMDQARKDATIARINLEKESINLQEKIDNRRTALEEKQRADEEKAAAAKKKAMEDAAKVEAAAIKNLEDLRVAAQQEGIDKEINKIQLDTERKIAALQGSEAQILEQRKLLEDIQGMEIQAIRDKYAKEAEDKAKKTADDLKKLNEKTAADAKKIDQEKTEFSVKMSNSRLDSERDVVDGVGGLLQEGIKNEKDAKAIKKSMGLIDIGINLVKELSANSLAAAANPLNAVTFGAAGVAQLLRSNTSSIIRAAIGAARIAVFRKGGIPDGVLDGPSHEDGGIPLFAEGQEIILTKGVYRNPTLRNMASQLNVAGGGRSFAAGGPANPFDQSRGPIQSNSAADLSGTNSQEIADLKMAFQIYAAKVDKWATSLQVQNNLQETAKGLTTLNQLQSESNV